MSRIVFLGTGGCGSAMHKQYRATGGILLQTADQQVHIDPGPGALIRKNENSIDLNKTTAVLVSNSNLEHSNDTNLILNTLSSPNEKKGKLIASQSYINPGGGFQEKCKEWIKSIHPVKPGDLIKLGTLNAEALPTKHEDQHALGFKLFTDKFILVYSSDTEYNQKITKTYEDATILILNTTQPMIGKQKNNLNCQDAQKIIEQVKPKLAILTHFSEDMLKSNPIYEAREIQKLTGIQTIAAYDGLNIDPHSYSAISTQKSLHYY